MVRQFLGELSLPAPEGGLTQLLKEIGISQEGPQAGYIAPIFC